MVTHSAGQPKRASVLKFCDKLALKNEKNVPPIAPVVRDVAGTVFDLSHAHIAHCHRAPQGDTDFAGVLGHRHALPIHNLET